MKSVKREIEALDGISASLLSNRLKYLAGKRLEEMLMTKILDKIRSKRSGTEGISLFELRVSKGKGKNRNVRAILCGREVAGSGEIVLHIVTVWEKDTKKIPERIIERAFKRCKGLI